MKKIIITIIILTMLSGCGTTKKSLEKSNDSDTSYYRSVRFL